MRNRIKMLLVAGAVAMWAVLVPTSAQAHHLPTCPYENHNACCGWIFIGSKGIKLFDCW